MTTLQEATLKKHAGNVLQETLNVRPVLAVLLLVATGSLAENARADPYRWCAQYSGKSGATNCYFLTLGQCRATVSGVGGFCVPNNFYDGRPVVTPEDAPSRKRR
jgi:uncharacterized protein DUF3551